MVLSEPAAGAESVAPLLWSRDEWCRTQFRALGTDCQLIYRPPSRRQGVAYRDAAVAWVQAFEQRYSRYREDSLISHINRAAGSEWVETDAELESMFTLCDHYHWCTAGVFDPTTLPLMKLWDYKAEHPVLPSDEAIRAAMEVVGWQRVQRRAGAVFLPLQGMALDLGGIGKEYAVDRVLEQARAFGINDLMVDFGRDVRCMGQSPQGGAWTVGLEHPVERERCWGGVAVTNRAVTTSGDYRRGVEIDGVYYSHIVDPRTGRPISNGCHSASVVSPTCTEAGVLSTAALILGREEGRRLIERSTFAQGCVWQGQERYDTARFAGYLIP